MHVRVLLFGPLKEALGGPSIGVDLAEGGTVGSLRAALAARHPERAGLLSAARLAVNHRFAPADQPLNPDDEIAIIEMVSGG